MVCALAGEFHIENKTLAKIQKRYGSLAHARVIQWAELINDDNNKALNDMEKLRLVNRFFNRIRFVSDRSHWGKKDYWATPMEFLSTNGGDCEDFSIAKYFTLRELGVSEDRLRLNYVKALKLNQAHMVVTYFKTANAEPLVLDNLISRIEPASRRNDLLPVYSFNGDGLWLSQRRGQGQFVGSSGRLSLWNDLRQRMQRMGAGNRP
jgi:predicted transglutaminase-like cysteine proteinase